MKLICIENSESRRRRATAEIELLLVIPVLLSILLLTAAGLTLGTARLANVFNAENQAYAQVTIGQNVTPANDPLPVDGITTVRPGLPNRFDEAAPSQLVNLTGAVNSLQPVTITDRAIFLDPTWHYASRPDPQDQPALQAWFEAYVAEDHPADITDALGLQPSWAP